jgi:phosphate transport system protein
MRLTEMGEQVCRMLASSLQSLLTADGAAAREVIAADRVVNRMEVDTDELCLRILARRQPVASDLRLIATALKMDTDLERIGDLCVNVCERIIELRQPVPPAVGARLTSMGQRVRTMIEAALRAFAAGDVGLAEEVLAGDQAVDAAYADTFAAVLEDMRQDPALVYAGTRLQSVAKYLERMGDHATNLGEMVIFMVRGQDVRHRGRLDEPPAPN